MTAEDILKKIQVYLEKHSKDPSGWINQSIYKQNFFRLFEVSYKQGFFSPSSHPRLTTDAMADWLRQNWKSTDTNSDTKKEELIRELCSMWKEWEYAMDNFKK